MRLVFAAARALKVSPYQLLAGASDRVLNPWGPNVVEWNRLRSSKSNQIDALPESDGAGEEPVGERVPEPKMLETEGWGGEPMEVLTGEKVRRAIEFLDEPGPSGRFEAE